jgi:hypothetical protein
MKKKLLSALLLFFALPSPAQFVAILIVEHEFTGACNIDAIYAIFGNSASQSPAVCPLSREEILNRLNTEITFPGEPKNYSDDGVVAVIINCKGELVSCYMDRKTENPQVDEQILAVFNTLVSWKVAILNGKPVDSTQLFNFTIRKGIFSFS